MDFTPIQKFVETYGWFILLGFVLIYYIFPNMKDYMVKFIPKRNTKPSISDIPVSNDDRILEARRKQQERLNRLTELTNQIPNSKKPIKTKKDKERDKFKKTSAYRKATTGKWGDGKPKPGSAVDNTPYRPNPWKRNGGRRKGG